MIHFAAAALAICGSLSSAYLAAAAGLSKLYSKDALTSGALVSADRAVGLTPSDPDAHFARAIALTFDGRAGEAIKEYERAASLRPRDYYLWLSLGAARDQSADAKGVLAAYTEAVRLAPDYAQPHWQLGNVLLRSGRRDEAFVELRRAAESDSSLLPGLIDLAWGIFGGDAHMVEEVVRPENSQWRLQLARFFIKHGKTAEGMAQFRAAGNVPYEDWSSLLQELLSAKRFREAYYVWSTGPREQTGFSNDGSGLTDGGFEELKSLDKPGFGWRRAPSLQAVAISRDAVEAHSGKYSLHLEYQGNSASNIISQLVVVEPDSRYRLRFSARTKDVVTGGLPAIMLTDAVSEQKIAESNPLPKNTNGWQDYVIEFSTGKETSAVQIIISRQACTQQPCPIFGNVWLDDFLLQKS